MDWVGLVPATQFHIIIIIIIVILIITTKATPLVSATCQALCWKFSIYDPMYPSHFLVWVALQPSLYIGGNWDWKVKQLYTILTQPRSNSKTSFHCALKSSRELRKCARTWEKQKCIWTCGEVINSRHESSKLSPEAAGETSSFWSFTVPLDTFLQKESRWQEVLGWGRRARRGGWNGSGGQWGPVSASHP